MSFETLRLQRENKRDWVYSYFPLKPSAAELEAALFYRRRPGARKKSRVERAFFTPELVVEPILVAALFPLGAQGCQEPPCADPHAR